MYAVVGPCVCVLLLLLVYIITIIRTIYLLGVELDDRGVLGEAEGGEGVVGELNLGANGAE